MGFVGGVFGAEGDGAVAVVGDLSEAEAVEVGDDAVWVFGVEFGYVDRYEFVGGVVGVSGVSVI